jgi:hypothetical protein
MNMLEEVNNLWQVFDEGYKHSNNLLLIEKLFHFINGSGEVSTRDKEMYERLVECVSKGGFLVKEEKQFLINYAILIVNGNINPAEQMRDSSSLLDVWPQKQGIRTDYGSGAYRKEALLWFIRMYEVLGNTFLHKRNYPKEYYGIELAMVLEAEKCTLKENEYAVVDEFLQAAESFINHDVEVPHDKKQSVGVMRKLIWKIKEGITKYS